MNKEKSFLGKGWAFPPTFNRSSGDVRMVSDENDIRQSLEIYLSTRRGERLMRLGYGSILSDHFFDTTKNENLSYLSERIMNDIRTYEPRIIVHSVEIDNSSITDGIVRIRIGYEVQSTNIRDNIVFPYYLIEGTHIQ
jgi:phage baseplate assembly protein W